MVWLFQVSITEDEMNIASIAAAALLMCLVPAQDGGKIPWKGKEKDADLKTILAAAKKDGKAMLMFFTSEG